MSASDPYSNNAYNSQNNDAYCGSLSSPYRAAQIKLINVVVKLSVLSMISVIMYQSFFIAMIMYLTSWLFVDNDSAGDRLYFKVVYSIGFILRWVACLINCICIVISLNLPVGFIIVYVIAVIIVAIQYALNVSSKKYLKLKVQDIKLSLCDTNKQQQIHNEEETKSSSIGNQI